MEKKKATPEELASEKLASKESLEKLNSTKFFEYTCHTSCFPGKKYNEGDMVVSTEVGLGHGLKYFHKGKSVKASDVVQVDPGPEPTDEQIEIYLAKKAQADKDAAKKASLEPKKETEKK